MTAERGNLVGVIGAGIAGLVTAKVLRDDGFRVVVFEKEAAPGGVWIESRTYPGLRTNNSRDTYAFSDHPYAESADVFPTAGQVREYLSSYIDRFGLTPYLRLSTEILRVSEADNGFELQVSGPEGVGTERVDFLVVCAGTFSEPNIPFIKGSERFGGKLLHSSQATDPELFTGKRVVVVGAGKSALDCADYAGEHARDCTLVFRKPYPMMPRYIFGVPSDQYTQNRFYEAFFRYHRLNRVERFLHGSGAPIRDRFWRTVGAGMRLSLRMPKVMVPDEPLPNGVEHAGLCEDFYRSARRGAIRLRRGSIASCSGEAQLELHSGDRIAADVVVFATGWRQSLTFLSPELRAAVLEEGRFRLYRHILPPSLPRLGFIGYGASTACQLTAEVSAHWLAQQFRGELDLPSPDAMQAEITRVGKWVAEVMPGRPEGYYVGPYLSHHIDELMGDMGLPVRRTDNFLSEYFDTFLPSRYCDLTEERLRVRERAGRKRRHPLRYLSAGGSLGGVAVLTLAWAAYRKMRER
ncbi:flavin-containing monooxygenase [Nocardia sp. NBC_00511]|uniref:flavin-containing monooxygenase n=1 Tax=Nocardia sp. NBC_00511 TaxID=2903591 RepID=UPI0030E50BB1